MARVFIAAPYLDGDFVEATSAKLSDPTGQYGVRNASTLEVVVPDGTNLSFTGDEYEYTFEFEVEGDESVELEAAFEIVLDGETYWSAQTITIGPGPQPEVKLLSFIGVYQGAIIEFSGAPRLSSPAKTYGVKRLSDNAVVLTDNQVMTAVGDGVYQRGFAMDFGREHDDYKFYVECVVGDQAYFVPSTTAKVNSSMIAFGRYTNTTLIADRFGVDNMHLWLCAAGDDKEEPTDYAMRAYNLIAAAEAEIDRRVHGLFVNAPYEEPLPAVIVEVATILAGIKMYEWRGVDDVDPESGERFHRLRGEKRDVDKLLKRIAMGDITEARLTTPTMVPIAGGDTPAYVNTGE